MRKTNNKPYKQANGKTIYETAEQLNAKLQKEINENKLNIDRACFTKTDEEKQDLKAAKKHWKKMQAA